MKAIFKAFCYTILVNCICFLLAVMWHISTGISYNPETMYHYLVYLLIMWHFTIKEWKLGFSKSLQEIKDHLHKVRFL